MNRYDQLVDEAAKAPSEQMVDIFRSGWQQDLFWKGLDAFILEDIANACNPRASDTARWVASKGVEDGLIRSEDFQRFSKDVATKRTILNMGGVG